MVLSLSKYHRMPFSARIATKWHIEEFLSESSMQTVTIRVNEIRWLHMKTAKLKVPQTSRRDRVVSNIFGEVVIFRLENPRRCW